MAQRCNFSSTDNKRNQESGKPGSWVKRTWLRPWGATPCSSPRETPFSKTCYSVKFWFHGPPTAHILCAPSESANTLVSLISKANNSQEKKLNNSQLWVSYMPVGWKEIFEIHKSILRIVSSEGWTGWRNVHPSAAIVASLHQDVFNVAITRKFLSSG